MIKKNMETCDDPQVLMEEKSKWNYEFMKPKRKFRVVERKYVRVGYVVLHDRNRAPPFILKSSHFRVLISVYIQVYMFL